MRRAVSTAQDGDDRQQSQLASARAARQAGLCHHSLALVLTLGVCLLQSIEHLRWDERKLDRVFNLTHLQPGAASWLGQDQVQEIQHNLEVR
jgi:hypothetical protein